MTEELDATLASDQAGAAPALAVGAHLGRYRLTRVLGSGGMGVVWAAHDPDLDREVAIKLLLVEDASKDQRTRLLREAQAMARLKHPNVLTVYEVGTDRDRDYIAIELVDGPTLDAWLAASPPPDEVWHAVLAAGRGLAAAHAAGLVHRDFKPHNVLRSRDGRVLVTDFGLARALGDEAAAATAVEAPQGKRPSGLEATLEVTPSKSRPADSVLDSPLTQTGALIGTPAYMAPEQFVGSPPDRRTDQFAFCVTAWQALAGERPFRGASLDELRVATAAGVANVEAKLPRAIRRVLARGLDPDPARRWPDLDALLAALEHAAKAPRRRLARGLALGGLTASALVIAQVASRPHAPPAKTSPKNACVAPEEAFAEVWTAERRAALERRVPGSAAATAATALDDARKTWLAEYAAACDATTGPKTYARIGCLLGERDELAAFARLADTLPAAAFDGIDLWGMLPRIEACQTSSPVVPPLLDDPKQRDRVVGLRVRLMASLADPEALLAQAPELARAAHAIGWEPLEAEVTAAIASAAQSSGRYQEARAQFASAADRAEQLHDDKLEATSRIALLEVETSATGDPADRARGTRLVEQARAAVHRAGDDPVLAASIDEILAGQALDRGALDAAISQLEAVRGRMLALHAGRQAHLAAANELTALAARARDGDLDTAWQIGLDTERQTTGLRRSALAPRMVAIAWRRGDLDAVHARADRLRHPLVPADAVVLAGHVTQDGKPVAGARVVTWRGELHGDATRLYTRPDFEGDVATTDESGAFSLHAPPGGAIMAEAGAARSAPLAIAAGPITLALAEARTITGGVGAADEVAGTLDAHVELAAGQARWFDDAIVGRDRVFRLAGVPAGGGVLAIVGRGRTIAAGAARDGARVAWPAGPEIEAIVRVPTATAHDVYVLRGHHRPRTRAELAALADKDPAPAHAQATPVGLAGQTAGTASLYAHDDAHVVIADNAPGEVTVCAVTAPDAAPLCAPITVAVGHHERIAIVLPPPRVQ